MIDDSIQLRQSNDIFRSSGKSDEVFVINTDERMIQKKQRYKNRNLIRS